MLATIIVDIDDVCFNAKARIARHTKDGKTNWNAAYVNEEVEKDPVIAGAPADTRRIAEQFNIVYLTGRSEKCRKATQEALQKNNFAKGRLVMRGREDKYESATVKRTWIDKLSYLFIAAVDDDDSGKLHAMYENCNIPHFISFAALFHSQIWQEE